MQPHPGIDFIQMRVGAKEEGRGGLWHDVNSICQIEGYCGMSVDDDMFAGFHKARRRRRQHQYMPSKEK
jgi:hypothetical protein